jgi:hypothetical protein
VTAPSHGNVFVNCPFDAEFRPIFLAIVFAILRCGFRPRCALEADDSATNRLHKIMAIIGECRFGIHDLSRTEVDGDPPLPRFNMPLELGIFLGARHYGGRQHKSKQALILDCSPYRYQKFMSDIAGQDIHCHRGEPSPAVTEVVNWLRGYSSLANVPGGARAAVEFDRLTDELPSILWSQELLPEEMTLSDYSAIVLIYLDWAGSSTSSNR